MVKERISIVTDEISQDFSEVIQFLSEHELKHIEIRMVGAERVPDINSSAWSELVDTVKSEGLKVLDLSPGTFKGHFTDRPRQEIELKNVLPRTIDRALEIGAGSIITFGFMAERDAEPPGYVIETLFRAAEICGEAGLQLLVENEPGSFAEKGTDTLGLVKMVDHPNLLVNWDPCNSGVFDNPEGLATEARTLGELIKHVHVKDGIPLSGELFPKYVSLSEGKIGWDNHVGVLKEMGYDGFFGIETHYHPLMESSAVLLGELREILDRHEYRKLT